MHPREPPHQEPMELAKARELVARLIAAHSLALSMTSLRAPRRSCSCARPRRSRSADDKAAGDTDGRDVVIDDHQAARRLASAMNARTSSFCRFTRSRKRRKASALLGFAGMSRCGRHGSRGLDG